MQAPKWSPLEIVSFMSAHPQRAYFSRLFRDGGFRTGMEVGVAAGRFTEHFLLDNAGIGSWNWTMMEPFPNRDLLARYHEAATPDVVWRSTRQHNTRKQAADGRSWQARGVGMNAKTTFIHALSMDPAALDATSLGLYDFIYLDGAHDYVNVKKEMFAYWQRVAPGGVLAGHDYCYRREKTLRKNCRGCGVIPLCGTYTEAAGKLNGTDAKSQEGVVRAVQEWLVEAEPQLKLHHTIEDFTEEAFKQDGIRYELVLTKTRNPSWYIIKPIKPAS